MPNNVVGFTLSEKRQLRNVSIALLLIAIAYLGIQLFVNGRFGMLDFQVYYTAAERISEGENLYRPGSLESGNDGHFRYKYAPTCAVYHLPFIALPYKIAGSFYWLLIALAVVFGGVWSYKRYGSYLGAKMHRQPWLILLVAVVAGVHTEAEFNLGQVNELLLLLYLLTAVLWISNRPKIWAALPWAASLFIKPYALIFIPYFIWYREWKMLVYFMGWMLVLFFLPLLFYGNVDIWWQQHMAWMDELFIELANKKDPSLPKNPTIFSLAIRYSPLAFLEWTPARARILQFAILAVMGLLGLWWLDSRKRLPKAHRWSEWVLLLAIIPLLAQSSANLFLTFKPLLLGIVLVWKRLNIVQKFMAIMGMLLYGWNIRDLWGTAWADYWDDTAVVGIGAVLLLIVWLWNRIVDVQPSK